MKILLTGASGQLGNELYPRLSSFGEVTAVDLDCSQSNAENCRQLDLGDSGALEVMLNRLQPDLIVNTAAFTAVDKAENEPELAFKINAKVPGRIARWAQRNDCALLHYSTDYVFDGSSKRPYKESDSPSPLNIYGESKLAGELAIEASGCQHLIIRTSWVYSAHGKNFVLSMLALAERHLKLSVVDDQFGCPTWARNLARASGHLIRSGLQPSSVGKGNIYHYCDVDRTSWYDFAQQVFSTAVDLKLLDESPELKRVSSGEYPQIANRPRYSVLDCLAIQDSGFQPANLAESLKSCMMEMKHE
ncbi:MAG: dTDP-4-dehydrorhamnose reductase [Lysobacterales bacterium]|jgi:dTDP-4-dehydrorhamnose reductase